MAGYIGSAASVVSSGAENKKTFTITGATTSLTGLNYPVGKVHVFQNGVRLVDGTDYTATNGTTITLTVAAQSGDNVVVISQADFQVSGAVSTSGDTMTGDLTVQGAFTSVGIDDNADAVALTIDSSENVLIGKTSQSVDTVGAELLPSGIGQFTVDGNFAGRFTRKTSDGDIIVLRKGTGTVGSIGVTAGDNIYFAGAAGNTKGLYLSDSGVIPCTTSGVPQDGTSDLGAPTVRFRHAYLSGGIYLGGAGSANALDDYEEGTWTPAVYQAGFTISNPTARYTKIGRLVTVTCDCDLSGTGNGNDMKISGLPFTSLSAGHASGAGYTQYYPSAQSGSNAAFVPKSGNNDTFVYFQNGNGARYDGDRFSAGFLNFTITYFTS
jgi:hypothetical protein